MKTTHSWGIGGNGTNSSGFAGLPGGYRNFVGYNSLAGNGGFWWSSSPDGSNAWFRTLYANYEIVGRSNYSQRYGFSVRCVQDAD